MSDLRTSGLQSSQSVGNTRTLTDTSQVQSPPPPQEHPIPSSEPRPESFTGLGTPPTTVGTQEDREELRSDIVDSNPSGLRESARLLPSLSGGQSEVQVGPTPPLGEVPPQIPHVQPPLGEVPPQIPHVQPPLGEVPPQVPQVQPPPQPQRPPSNKDLLTLSQDTTQPLEKRLQALTQLDLSGDANIRGNAFKVFRNQNKAELTQIHAHFVGQTQHLQIEYNALKGTLSKIPECQPALQKINQCEMQLSQAFLALGQALSRGEDVTALTAKIAQLRQEINTGREELMVSLPGTARPGQKHALETFLKVQDQLLDLKTQSLRLDLLIHSPAFSESGQAFLSREVLPTTDVVKQAKDNALSLELDKFQVKNPGDVSKLVAKIVGHQQWKLDSNEGFEHFFHKILGSEGVKNMPQHLRGKFLAELFKAGVGHPDLVVHFVLNNARNLTDKPTRSLLQRPEIKGTHIYQAASKGVLSESLKRLQAHHQAMVLIATLRTKPELHSDVLGNGVAALSLTDCVRLREALLDKHAGPNILVTSQQRTAFIKSLKDQGLDTACLEGSDAQKKLNAVFQRLVSPDHAGVDDPDVAKLVKDIKDKNLTPEVPALSRLYFEVQAHPEKDRLLDKLKAPQDLKFDAILGENKLPDMAKTRLLDEALRLNKPEMLDSQPALRELYDKLLLHPSRELLVAALKDIPVNEHEMETRILDRSEAVALLAYAPVLDAGLETPDFGRFETFHNRLKTQASVEGFNEGDNVKQFQNLQNRLSPEFFQKLDAVKSMIDPVAQKEAANRLLQDIKLERMEDRMEAFFMNYILKDIAEDRANREETDKQYKELLTLDRPLTSSDLRNLSKLVGANIEYYSKAVAQLNPTAPKTLSQIFAAVKLRAGEMGVTRLGEAHPTPQYTVNPQLAQVLGQVQGPSATPGKVSDFFKGITVAGGQPQNREWMINLAMIRHALAKVPKDDKATRDQLTLRAMTYLTRFAVISNPGSLGVQSSALQTFGTDYHRANGNVLVKNYRETLAKHLGVNPANLQAVTDSRVMEVVKRDLRMTGHQAVVDAFDPSLTAEDQGKLLKKMVTDAITGDDKKPFFVDITPVLARNFKGGSQDEAFVKDYIQTSRQFVSDVISSTAEEVALDRYKLAHPEDTRPESDLRKTVLASPEFAQIKKDLNERVVLGGTLNVGHQAVLYTAPLDTDFSSLNPVEKPLPSSASTALKNLVYHSGFTVGPQQMMENWAELSDLDSILASFKLEGQDVGFPVDQTGKLEKVGAWGDLLAHDTFKAFENLKNEDKPYLKILPSATASLLRGLNDSDLQRTFQAKGLGDLYQLSANRILSAMEQINANKDNFNKVLDQIQLIHEEIGTLLAIAQPHNREDFNAMMRRSTDMFPPDFDPSIQSDFFLKNSGMRGLATVFTGVEKLKGSGQLNIAVQNDTYYESAFVITGDSDHDTLGNREHSLFSLDGDRVDSTAQTMKDKLAGQKLDLYLCEFHHNISYSKTSYHMENLTAQVDKLFAEGMVSDHFTVAIDNTIAQTDSQAFKDFLKHNEKRIADGSLNIVFYRSAQKFDMLGMDNYNGGIMSVINNPRHFGAFNQQMSASDGREDRLSEMNVQGFMHLERYAQRELNQYRAGIMKAASGMANPDSGSPLVFPRAMYHADTDDMSRPNALLKIAANTDPSAVFLDLSCPLFEVDSKEATAFLGYLQSNLLSKHKESPEDFPLSDRASFGFPHSNMSLIGGSKFRFNPGLESEETLQNFQKHFIKLNEIMLEAFEGAPDPLLRANAVKKSISPGAAPMIKLRDQIKELEGKHQPVPTAMRLALAQHYYTLGIHGKAQEQITLLERQGVVEPELGKLNGLKVQIAQDLEVIQAKITTRNDLARQVADLESLSQPVPPDLRLKLGLAEAKLGRASFAEKQFNQVDFKTLVGDDTINLYRQLDALIESMTL